MASARHLAARSQPEGRRTSAADRTTGGQRQDVGVTERRGEWDERAERALDEPVGQDFVGGRDLAAWTTSVGRAVAARVLALARWAAPNRVLLATLLVGLAMASLLAAAAGGVYEAVVEQDGIAGLDQPVLDAAVQLRTPRLERVVTAYTDLGGQLGMTVLATTAAVVLSLWWRQWTPLVLLAATATGTLAMTIIGKAEVGRVRPPLAAAVPPYETSFSFPSGHSLNSVAIAGVVAYLFVRRQRHRWAYVTTISVAAVFAITMGLSRVYLGHHWLTDVLVAWALGTGWLAMVITAHRLFLTVRRDHREPRPG